jgi:hypothetical protein
MIIPGVIARASGLDVDPLYADTVLLLTAQAGNIDSSPLANTLTATGTPIINSTIPRNGAPTYLQDGTWRWAPGYTWIDAQLGTAEFCWEMWMYITQYSSGGLQTAHGFGGFQLDIGSTGDVLMTCGTINGSSRGGSIGTIALNGWNHFMLQRDNSAGGSSCRIRLALNGTQTDTSGTFSTAHAYAASSTDRVMGYHVSGSAPRFACAGMRLTKGSRRYLSLPFTPDDTPFYEP